MKIINIKDEEKFLNEYIELCSIEWGSKKTKEEIKKYIEEKKKRIFNEDKIISILGLIDNNIMLGFISLFKYNDENRKELLPWYATLYVKKEYRNKGYSRVLNDAILEEASKLGYNKVYLKTDLINYYEKFGAKYIEKLNNYQSLYYIDLKKRD